MQLILMMHLCYMARKYKRGIHKTAYTDCIGKYLTFLAPSSHRLVIQSSRSVKSSLATVFKFEILTVSVRGLFQLLLNSGQKPWKFGLGNWSAGLNQALDTKPGPLSEKLIWFWPTL